MPVDSPGADFRSDQLVPQQGERLDTSHFLDRLDLLFNNAGAGFSGFFDRQTKEDWEKAFALNFYGALYEIRCVLPIMRKQGSGHIVNIISGIAFMPMAYQTMYSATKAALREDGHSDGFKYQGRVFRSYD